MTARKTTKGQALQARLGFKADIRDLKEVRKHYAREVAEAEAVEGPSVPQQLSKRGRPSKGEAVERTVVQSFRVAPSVLEALTDKAREAGITTSAAIQLAVIEWARR